MDRRLLLAVLVLVGGLTVAVAGAAPQATLTPTEALDAEPGSASVKGMVASLDRGNGTFILTDGERAIREVHDGGLPAAVETGRSLVADGQIVHQAGRALLQADEIQIGCPSKYEA